MNNKTFERALLGSTAILIGAAGGAAAQDISGLYSGVALSFADADFTMFGGGADYSVGGNSGGLFAGYNFVQGDWVFGAELGWTGGYDLDMPYTDANLSDIVDIRARAGRVFGNTFVYGALGYWQGDIVFQDYCCPSEGKFDADGMSFAVGFETSMGANSFLGAELMSRNIDVGDFPDGGPTNDYFDFDNLVTATIRAGFRF